MANFYTFITFVVRKFLLRLSRVIGVLPIIPLDRPSRSYVRVFYKLIFRKLVVVKIGSSPDWVDFFREIEKKSVKE